MTVSLGARRERPREAERETPNAPESELSPQRGEESEVDGLKSLSEARLHKRKREKKDRASPDKRRF